MNYKPTESDLIAYLYGELDDHEKAKVERYLENNPEEKKRLRSFTEVSDMLKYAEDKEVIAPPIFTEDQGGLKSIWRSSYFRIPMSIAAAFLLVMLGARLMNIQLTYSGNEVRIGFGNSPRIEINEPHGITAEEAQSLINKSLEQNNQLVSSKWSASQEELNKSIQRNLQMNSRKIDDLVLTASNGTEQQMRTFVAGLQNENLKLMKDYLQLSSDEQKKYIENLLIDFSKYMQEQRNQDIAAFQTRMGSIEKNSNQFKQETEQILTSIITNLDGTSKKTNY